MSSLCQPPCPAPSACANTHPAPCAAAALLDPCSGQDPHPCPEQPFPADLSVCRGTAACPAACPQVGVTRPAPVVPVAGDGRRPEHAAARDSCAPPGARGCPATVPGDPPQSEGGTGFPASPVELRTPQTVGTYAETFPLQHPVSPGDPCGPEHRLETSSTQHPTSAPDPCALQTLGTCTKTFPFQHVIPTAELCLSETPGTCMESTPLEYSISAAEPRTLEVLDTYTEDLCTARSDAEPPGTRAAQSAPGCAEAAAEGRPSPRAPFRLDTCTAAIVERCLSRCQNWWRGQK